MFKNINWNNFFQTLINFKIIEIRHAWRAGIICAVCVFIERTWLKVESPEWVIFSAFTCVQASVGATFRKSKQRFLGTCLGCIFAFVIYSYFPKSYILFVCVLAICLFVAMYYILSYAYYISFFTLAALMLYLVIYPNGTHYIFLRLKDVGIGIIFGTLGSLVLWPDYAKNNFHIEVKLSTIELEKLFQLLRAWIRKEESLETVLAQKETCANQNQNVRDKILEIRQEVIQKYFTLKNYDDFMWSQEKILYTLLMIFNSIRSNSEHAQNAEYNLEILQKMYTIKIKKFDFQQRGKKIAASKSKEERLILNTDLDDLIIINNIKDENKLYYLFARLLLNIQEMNFENNG